MFDKPENAVLIAITKLKFVECSLGDEKEVLEKATDENNFHGYNVVPCEQDDQEHMTQLVEAIILQ